jgi:F-type H+-transporting ATPase subunit delta
MYELKIVRNYALALFDNDDKLSVQEKILHQLLTIDSIVRENKSLNYFICSPVNANSDKVRILSSLSKMAKFDKIVIRFLNLLVRKSRFNLIGEITEHYSKMFAEASGIKYAEVVSASKLNAREIAKVQEYLESKLKKIIKIKSTIDDNLIGGIIIKYDSSLIDCSVSGALEIIEKATKNASA